MQRANLKSLIQESKDGEWGKGEPFDDSVEMGVIRGTDFEDARIGRLDEIPVRFIPLRIADRKTLQPEDLLIETAGGSKGRPTGRSLFVKGRLLAGSGRPLTCASFSRFIRIDRAKANPQYVFWVLQHLHASGYMQQYNTQHTGVARFQFTTFANNEELPLPDRDVQDAIVSILSAYDDLIENNTRRIRILEEMAQTIYREWFVNFRFPGHQKVRMTDSPMGKIPEGWEVAQLDDLAEVNARSIKRGQEPEGIGYIDISSVSEGRIDRIERMPFSAAPGRARRLVQNGDVIWSCVRPNRRSYALVLNPAQDVVVSTGFAVITAQHVPFTYLYQALTTDDFVCYLTNNATGSAYPAVTAKDFEGAEILLPPAPLLSKFDDLVGPMLAESKVLADKNMNLRRSRDVLLPKLISGEVDVSDLAIRLPEEDDA